MLRRHPHVRSLLVVVVAVVVVRVALDIAAPGLPGYVGTGVAVVAAAAAAVLNERRMRRYERTDAED